MFSLYCFVPINIFFLYSVFCFDWFYSVLVWFDFAMSDGMDNYFEDNERYAMVAIVVFLVFCFEVLYQFHCFVLIGFILFLFWLFVWFCYL